MEKKVITILIVDDDPLSLKMLIEHIENLDYIAEGASSGEEALELLNENSSKYSLVIVDRMMEGIDGLTLLQHIKSNPMLRRIPVIMETGEAEPPEFVAAIKAGAFDFLYKPVEAELLKYVVRNALEKELLEHQGSFEEF